MRPTLLVALVALILAPAAQAQTRVDLYDARSNRQGYLTIDPKTGRLDTYDVNSRRTGYGTITPSGKVETFDLRGRRTGSGTLTPGGAIRDEGRR